MSLIQCPECSKKISLNAKICPNCAHPMDEFHRFLGEAYCCIAVFVILILVASSGEDSGDMSTTATKIAKKDAAARAADSQLYNISPFGAPTVQVLNEDGTVRYLEVVQTPAEIITTNTK